MNFRKQYLWGEQNIYVNVVVLIIDDHAAHDWTFDHMYQTTVKCVCCFVAICTLYAIPINFHLQYTSLYVVTCCYMLFVSFPHQLSSISYPCGFRRVFFSSSLFRLCWELVETKFCSALNLSQLGWAEKQTQDFVSLHLESADSSNFCSLT